jgi:hypothetical protein
MIVITACSWLFLWLVPSCYQRLSRGSQLSFPALLSPVPHPPLSLPIYLSIHPPVCQPKCLMAHMNENGTDCMQCERNLTRNPQFDTRTMAIPPRLLDLGAVYRQVSRARGEGDQVGEGGGVLEVLCGLLPCFVSFFLSFSLIPCSLPCPYRPFTPLLGMASRLPFRFDFISNVATRTDSNVAPYLLLG